MRESPDTAVTQLLYPEFTLPIQRLSASPGEAEGHERGHNEES
jgi:hypothetical protein